MEPTCQPPIRKSQSTSAAAPRKRRKRTVVSGAADDCFTCAREGSVCDRRRPYCSQCLNRGRDCAGYKTTLTWGVGVASRGKFRGLSLPITGAQPAATVDSRRRSGGEENPPGQTIASPTTYTFASDASPTTPSDNVERATLQSQGSPSRDSNENASWLRTGADPRAWPAPAADFSFGNPPVVDTSSPYTEPPRHSTTTNSSLQYMQTVLVANHQSSLQTNAWTESWPKSATSRFGQWQVPPACNASQPQETEDAAKNSTESEASGNPRRIAGHSPSFSQMLLARSVGRTPRLRYLISYYAEVIAPVIVAFDSPSNPFRTHILRLAQDSESLQEAIATLATSNLRQRRQSKSMPTDRTLPSRMSSLAHRALTDGTCQDLQGTLTTEEFAREEQYHRGLAVKALNMELADPERRMSDSVLATLFILCLFHACDTGVAQFKTQLAGVTKLLALRMRSSPVLSDELKWFIRVFTWYDTMAATTNDREIQLRGTCLDIAAVSDSEWGLENLTGCDASLFKYIAQLGRLNLLSQRQEVSTPALPEVFVPTASLPPSLLFDASMANGIAGMNTPFSFSMPVQSRSVEPSSRPLSPAFWAEWFALRQQLEAWRLPPPRWESTSPRGSVHISSPSSAQAYISPPSSPSTQDAVAPQNIDDVFHISESFRHSAILYSERLAYPGLPSSHPRIQHLVHRAMHHISLVKSDVYLLWPLFITGSECVLDSHRDTVRQRCQAISQDSGFFNNLSCLELLEKIWAQDMCDTDTRSGQLDTRALYGFEMAPSAVVSGDFFMGGVSVYPATSSSRIQGFRWHELMQAKRAEGEYLVV
ncbi:hypothetical protein CNMCM5793_001728 [Aspergillus hiratsukae]|uniref:Zn(2)-C6 fungal-type domain-containing protein n=1 Tax=Aspergillus hiratsukae TaxID=1194566 RepID=A0A8H6PBP2_9EURO|nr:hypothetical protein CNMCM5793_001728 [Aspergillus hiratsukae]KAF7169128.1 hypothetical protein CNMCM6106_004119 [Aspergillus hiratsukae]